jgi:phospholipase A-2-activating protein
VFRNGMVPEAYMWQNGKWDKIGDVITEGGGSGGPIKPEPKYYHGDQYFEAGNYDYLFDVDDESGIPKVIPFNDGGNPM